MASLRLYTLFVLLQAIVLLSHLIKSDDEEDLLRGINTYRSSLNLSTVTENRNAHCFADQIADQFKDQPCTNTTGANTVPGKENQFSNYPNLLAKCHLNITNTRDGVVMPACIPNLVPSIVLSNFTESQYSGNLNDTKYTGAGIGTEGNWVVVVLTTNTQDGSFAPATSAGFIQKVGLMYQFCFWYWVLFLVGQMFEGFFTYAFCGCIPTWIFTINLWDFEKR